MGNLESREEAEIAVSGCHNSSSTIIVISYKELLAEIIIGEDSAPGIEDDENQEIDMSYALPPQKDLIRSGTRGQYIATNQNFSPNPKNVWK